MIDTTGLDAAAALAAAVECRRLADRAEADLLAIAAHWADLHAVLPGERPAFAGSMGGAVIGGMERLLPLAGEGAPEVAEFAPAELGAALRIPSAAATGLVGDALELRHRLPRLWARVHAGDLQAWRARQVTDHTRCLSREAAGFVDDQLAPVAHKIGLGRVLTLVEVALRRFDPESAAQRERDAAEHRGVWVSDQTIDGTRSITIEADTLDATYFDQAIDDIATALGALGDPDTRNVRRARAIGVLADPQEALDLLCREDDTPEADTGLADDPDDPDDPDEPDDERSTASHRLRPERGTRRKATLYVHLTHAALQNMAGTARVEDLGPASLHLVRRWLGRHDVTLRPVLDIDDRTAVDAYETPHRIRETVTLRNPCCPFPWCDITTRRKDIDHITPYLPPEDGGPPRQTAAHLLAAPCRRHHRLKTHAGWTYLMPEPGIHLWRSPHGHRYLVDHTGTHNLQTT